jgi:hypothetical protein
VFDDAVYPPELVVRGSVSNPISTFYGFILYGVQFPPYHYALYYYSDERTFDEKDTSFEARLVLDQGVLHMISAHINKDGRDSQTIQVTARLHHHLSNNALVTNNRETRVSKTTFIQSLLNSNKQESSGLKPLPLEPAHLSQSLLRLRTGLTESVEGKIMLGLIDFIKMRLLKEPVFVEMAQLQPLVSQAKAADRTISWILAAGMLALQEIQIRQSLKDSAKTEGMKFEELYRNFRKLLQDNAIDLDEMKLSRIKTSHDYRNKVIHEGILPTEEHLKDVEEDSNYIDYLVRMLKAKRILESNRP